MSLPNPTDIITERRLSEFYQGILPYLGGGSSGSGGHTIENGSGTDMAERSNLQFKGLTTVSDDSTNDRTIVDVPAMTAEDLAEVMADTPVANPTPDLDDLGNVNISGPTNDEILKYDSTSHKWVNGVSEVGGHNIEDDTGTDMTKRTNLQFKGLAGVSDDSTNDRTVVDVPPMTAEDLAEVMAETPVANPVPELDDLSNVSISGPTGGQALIFDGTTQKWVNGAGGSGAGGHTIEDSTGTDMTARANLQFTGLAEVSDDSTNDRTVVDLKEMVSTDMSEIVTPLPPSPSSGGEIYSETEQIIGTWIDGKPLYQKTVVKNNIMMGKSGSTLTSIAHNVSNLKECISLNMSCPKLGVEAADSLISASCSLLAIFRVNDTNIYAAGATDNFGATSDRYWYLTIRYTKTTD